MSCRALSIVSPLLVMAACAFAPARADESIYDERAALTAEFAQRLEALAAEVEKQGLTDEAARTRAWILPTDPRRLVLGDVPRRHDLAPPQAQDESADKKAWREKLKALRESHGEGLFTLARRAIRLAQPSLAFELIMDCLHEDPDHLGARRLLGQRPLGDHWATPYEIKKQAAGFVWHEKFGWIKLADVPRYEAGQRLLRGRWVTAEEDAQAHSAIASGWQVESEHYFVITNHSLEAGVELVTRLERLYDVWQRVFATYTVSQEQLARWLEGQGAMRNTLRDRMRVVYFRDRDEYNENLRPAQPNIDMTIGIYFSSTKTAYFFAGEDQDAATLNHEATHQLFNETHATTADPGREANFWIVEGVALYMESLEEHPGYVTLGGPENIRVQAARHRLLVDDFYVPFAELTGYGRERLQRDERIAMLYSQSTGLAHFLMHADHGRHREAMVRYLGTVYSGRDRLSTLAEATGTTYDDLDTQYRAFMEAEPVLDPDAP